MAVDRGNDSGRGGLPVLPNVAMPRPRGRVQSNKRQGPRPPAASGGASSSANRWSRGQMAGYAAMNRGNSARIATNRARRTAVPTVKVKSSGLRSYGKPTSGGAIGQAHQSFFDIGAFLRSLGR